MNQGIISRRYASALWMYAEKNKQEDEVYAECKMLNEAFIKYEALKRVLDNRTLSQDRKEAVLDTITGKDSSEALRRFIHLLFVNQREEFLQTICLSYQHIYREKRKLLNAYLVTAMPVEQDTAHKIIEKIERRTGQTVDLKTEVNPSIVGGYIITLGTYRLDTSVAARLRKIKERLLESKNF